MKILIRCLWTVVTGAVVISEAFYQHGVEPDRIRLEEKLVLRSITTCLPFAVGSAADDVIGSVLVSARR